MEGTGLAELARILVLDAGYNTALVMAGSTVFGVAAGVIGCFTMLRRRSMISDAISHATLPGIALAFLCGLAVFGSGRNIVLLSTGAAATGVLGILAVHWIRERTRLGEDAAIGTVLSGFFGAGVVLMSHVQTLPAAGQAGLDGFLLGATATMTADEAVAITVASVLVMAATLALLRPFAAVCLDEHHASNLGLAVVTTDMVMTALLLLVVVTGLKTVGLILVIALVIIPPVTARFWTERLGVMLAISGLVGGGACYAGSAASAFWPDMPTGAVIVILAAMACAFSVAVAPVRGVVSRLVHARRFRRRVVLRQALLACSRGDRPDDDALRILRSAGLLGADAELTMRGHAKAAATASDWRLWELYLECYPERALATPEWGSRPIDEVLPADTVAELRARAGSG